MSERCSGGGVRAAGAERRRSGASRIGFAAAGLFVALALSACDWAGWIDGNPSETLADEQAPVRGVELKCEQHALPVGRDELLALLEAADFAAFDASVVQAEEAYRAEIGCERQLWEMMDVVWSGVLSDSTLDEWLESRPDSYAALTLRGWIWLNRAWSERGNALAKDVSAEQWRGMHEALARSQADLQRAIELRPDFGPAWGFLVEGLKLGGGDIETPLARFLALDPLNYGVRRRALEALDPVWGGSLEAMERVAQEAQQYAEQNPRLPVLLGFPHAARGNWECVMGRCQDGFHHYRRALSYGDYHTWHYWLVDFHQRAGQQAQAVIAANAALEAYPNLHDMRVRRGRANGELGRQTEAMADFDRVLEENPRHYEALFYRGIAHLKWGRHSEAAEDLTRAVSEQPNNRWVLLNLGHAQIRGGQPERALEPLGRLVEQNPDDAVGWYRYAEALAGRGGRRGPARLPALPGAGRPEPVAPEGLDPAGPALPGSQRGSRRGARAASGTFAGRRTFLRSTRSPTS